MRFASRIALIVAALALMLVGIGFLLPATWQVEHRISTMASSADIFPLLNEPKHWPSWSPWSERSDSTLTLSYNGEAEGVGAKMRWRGESLGTGDIAITESNPQRGIAFDLSIPQSFTTLRCRIILETQADGTSITWKAQGTSDLNIIIDRYASLFASRSIGKSFAQGLENLKILAEEQAGNMNANTLPREPPRDISDSGSSLVTPEPPPNSGEPSEDQQQ